MSKIAVIGAGKTGRGFLARLLQEAQEEIILIDKNAELVEQLGGEVVKMLFLLEMCVNHMW